ncbi:hypothetical protein B0T10DRAFT_539748 [Thelonectria olida]|uniref:Mitochondrial inner membrane protein 1 n=1 Tax=Thelonectria olida TaxID=1576542 RepID=A0A9P9AMC5_9HYPO|nr:hypothetical protein B0T10DRAFT_539748 [Thelonectria olida]
MFRASRSLFKLASGAPPSTSLVTRASTRIPSSRLVPISRVAFSSSKPPPNTEPISKEEVESRAKDKLKSDPAAVSTQSSVRHVRETSQAPNEEGHDMAAELKHDLGVVKDTFRFRDVPRESRILGLAGTLPYLGTSLSTVFLSWDLNKQWPTGNSFYDSVLVDHETARYLLNVIEPLQLGYGAVIISFLGAIHWGLEYAEKTPHPERTRLRYGIGLAASVIAWPTIYMPIHYALTAQFAAFVGLYFVDSRATTRGWAPHWYGTYRFLLTAMVGLAIFISLVGRANIGQAQAHHELVERRDTSGLADHDTNWAKLEQEEKQRIKEEKEKAKKKAEKEEQEKKQQEMKEKKGHKQPDNGKDKAEEKEGNDETKKDEDDSEPKKDEESEGDDKSKDEKKGDDDKAKHEKEKDEDGDKSKDDKDSESKDEAETKDDGDKKKKQDTKKDTKRKGGKGKE